MTFSCILTGTLPVFRVLTTSGRCLPRHVDLSAVEVVVNLQGFTILCWFSSLRIIVAPNVKLKATVISRHKGIFEHRSPDSLYIT